jgi:hypothetical protein
MAVLTIGGLIAGVVASRWAASVCLVEMLRWKRGIPPLDDFANVKFITLRRAAASLPGHYLQLCDAMLLRSIPFYVKAQQDPAFWL